MFPFWIRGREVKGGHLRLTELSGQTEIILDGVAQSSDVPVICIARYSQGPSVTVIVVVPGGVGSNFEGTGGWLSSPGTGPGLSS